MRRFLFKLILIFLAGYGCGTPEVQTPTPVEESEIPPSSPVPADLPLYGTLPPEALPAPAIQATNRDGASRERSALLGQPTVLWFCPAAGTAG